MDSNLGFGKINTPQELDKINYPEKIEALFNDTIIYPLNNDLRISLAQQLEQERKELRKLQNKKEFKKENEVLSVDMSETTQKLAIGACVLDPQNKLYWRAWATELSFLDHDDRYARIDDVSDYTDGLPQNELDQEFYADFIGKDQIGEMLEEKAPPKNKSDAKTTFSVAGSKFVVPRQENVDVYCYKLVQKGEMVFDRKDKQIVGLNLAHTVNQQAGELGNFYSGQYLLQAARFAENDKSCVTMATEFVEKTILEEKVNPLEASELISTTEILLEKAQPTTLFAKAANAMLSNLKKEPVTSRNHPQSSPLSARIS